MDPARVHAGGDWLFTEDAQKDPVWGHGDEILWHTGEGLLIVGPTGVGKTTLTIQLLLALIGVRGRYVLGYPISQKHRVLYLAGDRPDQFRRAMLRNVTEDERDDLNDRLTIWRGPTPQDIARHPTTLVDMCQAVDADVVIIDSLKDAALRLSDDDTGGGIHRAVSLALVHGIEVLALHHQRKGQEGRKPTTIEDVYGSTWIVNGAGSVLLLWGDPGSQIVEMTHLKQPAGTVGPYTLEHDHLAGSTSVLRGKTDILAMVADHGSTILDVARLFFSVEDPSEAQRKKVERRLERLVTDGKLRKLGVVKGGSGGSQGGRYFIAQTDANPAFPTDTSNGHRTDVRATDISTDIIGHPKVEKH